jgi:ribosome recycling factor
MNEFAVKERKKADSKKGGGKGKNQDEDREEQVEDLNYEEIAAAMEAIAKKFAEEISTLKVGKADVTLLDKVYVTTSGKSVPLKAVAQVSIKDGATLSVAVFDQTHQKDVLTAIRDAKLDLNPTTLGNVILVPVPKPTKEFKDKLVKMAQQFAETSRLNIRGARRTAMDKLKKLKLPEDDNRNAEKEVQRLHDKFIKQVDEFIKKKEQDLQK